MATSSITKTFVISGFEQTKKFADTIENSYQESLHRTPQNDLKIQHLRGAEEVKRFMARRKENNAQ